MSDSFTGKSTLQTIARRTFLQDSAMGLGSIALASLLQCESHADSIENGVKWFKSPCPREADSFFKQQVVHLM